MLEYKILSKKPIININNEEFIDLHVNTYKNSSLIKGSILVVNKYYVARPDLISLAIYGTDAYGDLICKVNGISNPFELNENDVIFIPSPNAIHDMTLNMGSPSELIENNTNITNNIIDNRKKISEKRSPNELVYGESNYVIDKSHGLVFY